ncbi:MAG: hypothetical protein LW832_10160 [Parachlamydia sp.]|nr:hypothetical protein [Parachlamydia sp.]
MRSLVSIFFIFILFTPLSAAWQFPPEALTTSGAGGSSDIAANTSGEAVAVWIDNFIVKASHFTDGQWGEFTTISQNAGINGVVRVAYDDSDRALAIWVTVGPPNAVRSSFFNGTTWSEPLVSPLDTSSVTSFTSPSIAMDGKGGGLAAWIELGENDVRSSNFSSSRWRLATTIGTGNGTVDVAYNSDDTGVAVWTNGGVTTANYFFEGVWLTPQVIGTAGDKDPQVGIASNGGVYAIWLNQPTGTILTAQFNGFEWTTPEVISTGIGNYNPRIAVSPEGVAVALWIDGNHVVQSSTFSAAGWSEPKQVDSSTSATEADLAIAANGNAMALWVESDNQIQSATQTPGGNWDSVIPVGTFSAPPFELSAALSSEGPAFGTWTHGDGGAGQNAYASFTLATLPPKPPFCFHGKVKVNASATQFDRLHVLEFNPSIDKGVIFYRLRRNGSVLADIPLKGPFEYIDHHRSKKRCDTYTLTSVNAGDLESSRLKVKLK